MWSTSPAGFYAAQTLTVGELVLTPKVHLHHLSAALGRTKKDTDIVVKDVSYMNKLGETVYITIARPCGLSGDATKRVEGHSVFSPW